MSRRPLVHPDRQGHRPRDRVDIHQHLWTERLYAVLSARREVPRLRRPGRAWLLELAGEAPFALPDEPRDPATHERSLEGLGVDAAALSLSTALGVEHLPEGEARAITEAWAADCDELPARLLGWGSIQLAEPDPGDVDACIDSGRIGVALPATSLATPRALARLGPVLERLAARDGALFVHPGPAPPGAWLPPLTSYVSSLSVAWHAWALHGRPRHRTLRVVFAALAGLGPLHRERLEVRLDRATARRAAEDPLTFFDTSSYGPLAVAAMGRTVGRNVLVHGSDWPYAQPRPPGSRLMRAVLEDNPAALLSRGRPAAAVA